MSPHRSGKVALAVSAVVAMGSLGAVSACSEGTQSSGGDQGELTGRGPFTYVQVKGNIDPQIDQWNEAHPDEQATIIYLPSAADQQRTAMVNNAQTKSDQYCVEGVDIAWMSEFAAHGWITPIPESSVDKDGFVSSVWDTATYRDQLYGVPANSNAGILYYRSDILAAAGITEVPTSWEEMISDWEKVRELPEYAEIGGYGTQLKKYEGFTVTMAETINTAGGVFLDEAGQPAVASEESAAGIRTLVDGLESGFIPKEALTYEEETGREAFEAGRILFYRNWPYQYSSSSESLGTDKFGVAPLPTVNGRTWVSSLGGRNVAISSYCKNKASALDFIEWFTAEEQQQYRMDNGSLAPVSKALYASEENKQKYPYFAALSSSIESSAPRPKVPQYGDATALIQDSLYPIFESGASVDTSLSGLDEGMTELLSGN